MVGPADPFERYRTRSAIFLIIYAITAIIFGIPNLRIAIYPDDKFYAILITSILTVSKYISYFKLAGFALLEPQRIKSNSYRIMASLWFIVVVLLTNAAFLIYRFGFRDISVVAFISGSLLTASVVTFHLICARHGLNRYHLMKMVSGTLIVLGASNICIIRYYPIPSIAGLVTLFFGVYTERKSLSLAMKQTLAVTACALGFGIAIYFLRFYFYPEIHVPASIIGVEPYFAIILGIISSAAGGAYYFYARRMYSKQE